MFGWIDSHAHLSSSPFALDCKEVVARAIAAQLVGIVNICTDVETLARGLDLAEEYDLIYNGASTTPHDVAKEGELFFPIVQKAAKEGKLSFIGETGLDYHYQHSPKDQQQEYLKRYLHLAASSHLPVIFHCRDAFNDLFTIADQEYEGLAILHCFTGTLAEAQEVIKRGWYLSLSGIITFKKSEALREVVRMIPLSQLLIETDAPYLAPQKQRGKRNEPAFLIETAACIADLKGISLEEVAQATFKNTMGLLNR
jgi:TatD DNase family protein